MARVVAIFLWVMVFASLAWVSLPNYEIEESVHSNPLWNRDTELLSQMSFTPAGDILGYGIRSTDLTVRIWSKLDGRVRLDRTIDLPEASKTDHPVFAISSDASQIAWISPDGLHVEPLFGGTKSVGNAKTADDLPLRRAPVSYLAFLGTGRLAGLFGDGELALWDLTARRVTASRTVTVTQPSPLIAKGTFLAFYSFFSRETFVFDTTGDRFALVENSHHSSDIISMALSPNGRLAIASREKLEQQLSIQQAPGPIHAMDFFDRTRVIVAGDFTGIFLLGPEHPTLPVLGTADAGSTLLAANESTLAFGTERQLHLAGYKLVELHVYKGFSRPSTWLAIAFLGLISPIAIPVARWGLSILRQWLLRFRKPPVEGAMPTAADDENLPKFLIDACRNGDCVLYAGAGLSAQAGLPVWDTAVAELIEWAAGAGLFSRDAAQQALTDQALGNQPGSTTAAAADKLAEALEGHGSELVRYLRGRFRVSGDLSPAHQLIKQIDFPALITTNFDNIFERAFPYSGGRVYTARACATLERAAARRDFFLLKPFGDLDEPDTIRLGPAQCDEVIEANPACREFLEQLLDRRTLLFLGASLQGIEGDLGRLAGNLPVDHKHFAFVAASGASDPDTIARLRERYGIQTVTYTPSSTSHTEVIDFLQRLLNALREKVSTDEYFVAGGGK